jgi:hypothetical protein
MASIMFFIIGLLILKVFVVLSAPDLRAAGHYYYSDTFTEADGQFTMACRHAGGSIEYFDHPQRGVRNESLRAAVCAVGKADARSVVFTVSGTHGVEGYAGSMAQISMLRGPPTMYPEGVRMVHLHMINPYGASFILKENEQNADQLKNYAGYYALNYTNTIVDELLNGIDLPNAGNATIRDQAIAHYTRILTEYGQEKVGLALSMGQGSHPQGIAYFGPKKSWSSNTTDQVVNKYLVNAEQILLIDWHTAVGPYGEWTFLPMDPESNNTFRRWTTKVPIGLYDVGVPPGGELPYSKLKAISGAKRVTRGLWEAGTFPVDASTNAYFILRLHCHFYGNVSEPFCGFILTEIQKFFYPQLNDWKARTFNAINNVLPEILAGFAADGRNTTVVVDPNAAIVTSKPMLLILFTLLLSRMKRS